MVADNEIPQELNWAYKEWWGIVTSILAGRQTLLLRKGGLHEGPDGFTVDHPRFWFFPTYFHQADERLQPSFRQWLQENPDPVGNEGAESDGIRLPGWAELTDVIAIKDVSQLPLLGEMHGWSLAELERRFHYKRPGLFLLIIRAYQVETPIELLDSPHFAGCKSWVDLPSAYPTQPCRPAMDDHAFETRRQDVLQTLSTRTV